MSQLSLFSDSPGVAVIVPTYKEAENLPRLVERLDRVRRAAGIQLDLLVMDDDSQDGTRELFAELPHDWICLVVRTSDRGLSPAVVDGFSLARQDLIVVMDADLSHPPETIPEMIQKASEGYDFIVGSRYVPGGSTHEHWGVLRWINSRVATVLARPLTRVKDPMSGFFAFRRALLDTAAPIDPIGYKIGLELLVKSGSLSVAEIPIHFAQRERGHSKLSLREQLRYLRHLRRLYVFKYPNLSYLVQFLLVGLSGLAVNLTTLTILLWLRTPLALAVFVAIAVSLVNNFYLNRRFTFAFARGGPVLRQFAGFALACSLGAAVNYAVTLLTVGAFPSLVPQLASTLGVVAGTGFNFVVSRYVVFRVKDT